MAYLWWKAVHLIGVVSWFAGLFYLVRLFIYHAEAHESGGPEREVLMRQYGIMERRLYYMITYPAMVITVVTAIALLILQPGWLSETWMWLKLTVAALLLVYHYWCEITLKRLARGDQPPLRREHQGLRPAPAELTPRTILPLAALEPVAGTGFNPSMEWQHGTGIWLWRCGGGLQVHHHRRQRR